MAAAFQGIGLALGPVIALFFLGYVLKLARVLKTKTADILLLVNFYIAIPAAVLLSVSTVPLTREVVLLPIAVAITVPALGLLSWIITRALRMERPRAGVFIVGTMIMNIGFLYPFIIQLYGSEGFAFAMIIDIVNTVLTFSVVYAVALHYGSGTGALRARIKKLLVAPPLWAIIIALGLNISQTPIIAPVSGFLELLAPLIVPLVMLSLGIYFSPKITLPGLVGLMVVIRMLCGGAIGLGIAWLLGLEGVLRIITILCFGAPLGYNTLTYSSLEDLDTSFAASAISASDFLGIIFVVCLTIIL